MDTNEPPLPSSLLLYFLLCLCYMLQKLFKELMPVTTLEQLISTSIHPIMKNNYTETKMQRTPL